MKTKIKAEIVAHSVDPYGNELVSVLATFPRIILAEVNTHRMLSKNTSSSRAIPFKKMVESVENDPFIPIAWQKNHPGMQGTEYLVDRKHENAVYEWLKARDFAVKQANIMNNDGVTKQLCNRLLEPFMWTTMLITGNRSDGGWDNFFRLRCPSYTISITSPKEYEGKVVNFESKKEFNNFGNNKEITKNWSNLDWLLANKGQAEIHIMDLAEKIYDAVQNSDPRYLNVGEWHIPFGDKIDLSNFNFGMQVQSISLQKHIREITKVRISTAMAARTSYTVVGEEKGLNYSGMIDLCDRLLVQDPPHSSPMEHASQVPSKAMYEVGRKIDEPGWFGPYRGFMSYRFMIDNNLL